MLVVILTATTGLQLALVARSATPAALLQIQGTFVLFVPPPVLCVNRLVVLRPRHIASRRVLHKKEEPCACDVDLCACDVFFGAEVRLMAAADESAVAFAAWLARSLSHDPLMY